MLTRAEITSIDYNTNVCTVRIPIFETTSDPTVWECEAVIAIPPGVYNGYKTGDAVIVGFENHEEGLPVVLGKLYIGMETEKNSNSAISCSDIKINNSLDIPATTTFNFNQAEGTQNVSSAAYNISSLLVLIQQVLNNKTDIETLNEATYIKDSLYNVKDAVDIVKQAAAKDNGTYKLQAKVETVSGKKTVTFSWEA